MSGRLAGDRVEARLELRGAAADLAVAATWYARFVHDSLSTLHTLEDVMRVHFLGLLAAASIGPPSTPSPTPVPSPTATAAASPRDLAGYARTTILDRDGLDPSGPVVLTDERVAECAARGLLTEGALSPGPTPVASSPDSAERARWRQRYRRQRGVIDALQGMQERIVERIRALEREKPDARNFARIDGERAELERLEARIRDEERKLAAIVRAARQRGAQPGWFRGVAD